MSNGAFDASWPKSGHATRALATWLKSEQSGMGDIDLAVLTPLFDALADTTAAPDGLLRAEGSNGGRIIADFAVFCDISCRQPLAVR